MLTNTHARPFVLVHSQGMQAVQGKKWAFFICSGLMTTSSTTLGELRISDNQKQQEAIFFAAGVDISTWDPQFSSAVTARKQVERCIAKEGIL